MLDFDEILDFDDPISLDARGWRQWRNEPLIDGDLWLCPLSDWENVPAGTVLTSITGERKTKGKDYIDLDTRFGLLAYGVVIKPGPPPLNWSVGLGKILPAALQPGEGVVE